MGILSGTTTIWEYFQGLPLFGNTSMDYHYLGILSGTTTIATKNYYYLETTNNYLGILHTINIEKYEELLLFRNTHKIYYFGILLIPTNASTVYGNT